MTRILLALLTVAFFAACEGDNDQITSEPTDPTKVFDIQPPEVDTGWPYDTDTDT